MEFGDVLATLDAPQQAEEVGLSQLTQALVLTKPTQPQGGATPAADGATPAAGGATPTGGGTPYATGSSQAAMVTVTTPPEIIPYYHLNHSIWSLSDNKEVSR
jgi:hypothetical protein